MPRLSVAVTALCLVVFIKETYGRIIFEDNLECDDARCEVRADTGDYVKIERSLTFEILDSKPPHDPFCHPNYNVCHNYSGTTFLRISGTFNGKDVTHVVFSSGKKTATLLVHRASEDYPSKQHRILYASPDTLTIEDDYTVFRPVQITIPYFAGDALKCTAYFGRGEVPDVVTLEEDTGCDAKTVCVKRTGSRSSVKIHGKVSTVPLEIAFSGEGGEKFVFAFLSSHSNKYNLLLLVISLILSVIRSP
uniref:CUB domain-containing protein n=1 Tax=Mesocestoides corti TaxID=53468 RepID=A0A5K3EUA1_MESCO